MLPLLSLSVVLSLKFSYILHIIKALRQHLLLLEGVLVTISTLYYLLTLIERCTLRAFGRQ